MIQNKPLEIRIRLTYSQGVVLIKQLTEQIERLDEKRNSKNSIGWID